MGPAAPVSNVHEGSNSRLAAVVSSNLEFGCALRTVAVAASWPRNRVTIGRRTATSFVKRTSLGAAGPAEVHGPPTDGSRSPCSPWSRSSRFLRAAAEMFRAFSPTPSLRAADPIALATVVNRHVSKERLRTRSSWCHRRHLAARVAALWSRPWCRAGGVVTPVAGPRAAAPEAKAVALHVLLDAIHSAEKKS